ncbi:MAG: glycosyltransferase family 87 protein [Candidatus Heimdallarchaeota archaeon]
MDLNTKMTNMKHRFKEISKYPIFRYSVLVHILYMIISIILILVWFENLSDFKVFYKATEVFINNVSDLYNRTNYPYPYRYFPLSVIVFIPFYFMGFDLGFIAFTIFNLFLNFIICIYVYKIIILTRGEDHEKEDRRIIHYLCLYFMGLPQVSNYFLGQNNLIVTLMIILSLFIFLKYDNLKMEFLGSLLLGVSIIVKPVTLAMIPFLLLIRFNIKEKRVEFKFIKSLVRVVGCLIPLSLNIIYFFLVPGLWNDFITTNFTGTEPVDINFSFSVSKIIINLYYFLGFNYNQMLILVIVLIIFGGLGFLLYITRRFNKNSLIYGYLFGIIITLIVYFDSWDHHLLSFTPLLIIIIFNLPRNSEITRKSIKPSFMFFNFINLGFMGLFVLTAPFFPFNFIPTIFLILTFYGISKYILIQKEENK